MWPACSFVCPSTLEQKTRSMGVGWVVDRWDFSPAGSSTVFHSCWGWRGKEAGGVVIHANGSPVSCSVPVYVPRLFLGSRLQADTVGPCEGGKAGVFSSPSQSRGPFIPLLQPGKLAALGICGMRRVGLCSQEDGPEGQLCLLFSGCHGMELGGPPG